MGLSVSNVGYLIHQAVRKMRELTVCQADAGGSAAGERQKRAPP
jgi:hypothetical protein